MKKYLVPLLKIGLVAAAMLWVFSTIQLEDQLTEGTATVSGEVVGPWDQASIRFRAEGESEPKVYDPTLVTVGILTYLKNMSVGWFALGALCYLMNVAFASTRWWWLLRVNQLPITYWATFRFTWMGLFFNNVVPGQTGGDLVKAIYVMKQCEGARVPAMMSVVVDRIMGLASLSILAAIAVLFYLGDPQFDMLALMLWGVLLGVLLLGVIAFSRRVRNLIRLKQLLEMLPEKVGNILKSIDNAVYFYRGHKLGMLGWLFAGLFNHVFSVFSYTCVGIALGVGMPPEDYFVLIPVIVTISAIPIAPNGWGVGEAMFTFLFGKFGAQHLVAQGYSLEAGTAIMKTRGAALSVVFRCHLTAWSLLGGILYFFDKNKVTRAELQAEVDRSEDGADSVESAGATTKSASAD